MVSFAGQNWTAKTGNGMGPGPNSWLSSNVSVSGSDELHLKIARNSRGNWTSAEVYSDPLTKYGEYRFTVRGYLDGMHPHAVFGGFVYVSAAQLELDVLEIIRGGAPATPKPFQHVVWNGAPIGTDPTIADRKTFTASTVRPYWGPRSITACLIWAHERAVFWTYDAFTGERFSYWTFKGAQVPNPASVTARFHFNLWGYQGYQGFDRETEVVVCNYQYTPNCIGLTPSNEVALAAGRLGWPATPSGRKAKKVK